MYVAMCVKELNGKKEVNIVDSMCMYYEVIFVSFSRSMEDRVSTVVKVLRYKSEVRWFDPR
jgi:hypothetical protein